MQIENKNDTILYKYDNQGNTLEQKSSKGVISYTYDIYNRTRQVVTENGDIIKNKYDPLGFRYQKEVNGDTNRYIFDGWSIVAETNKEGELKSREVRGYSLVKKEKEETTYYYHQNEHGDVTHLTNVDGEIENSYSYDVFGSIREEKEAVFNYFKYSGEQYEKEIEQYYLRARFYNPVIGRFTQEDVYRGDGLNLYVYVVNNPLLWVDPSGYTKCSTSNDDSKNLINGPNNQKITTEYDNLVYGGYYTRKNIRTQDYADRIPPSYNKPKNIPKIVRRFMSRAEYKQFKKVGFTYDPKDPRQGISATKTNLEPRNPDKIISETGAKGADYYVDIDVSRKKIGFKGNTKEGRPDYKIRSDVTPDDIVDSGRVSKK